MTAPDRGRARPAVATLAVEARELHKRYGGVEAVRGVTLEVPAGEMFAFLGPNGAGKSTTISMLCTLTRPSQGVATVAGFDVVTHPAQVRRHIGLVFQDTTLDVYLTARENLRFHAELYGVPRQAVAHRVDEMLEMVDLADRQDSLVATFSGGMKRRLEIARGLLHEPDVLFLDEPTLGLDPQTRVRIWEYIAALRRRQPITIFLTTHYLDEAEGCDRIAVIDRGAIVVQDTPDALKASVAQDRVELQTVDDGLARRHLRERFGVDAAMVEGQLRFAVGNGEAFIPELFGRLGVTIRAVRVARPTIDDVFMAYTGRKIRDEGDGGAPSKGRRPGRLRA